MSNESLLEATEMNSRDIVRSFIRAAIKRGFAPSAIEELRTLLERMIISESIEGGAVVAALNVLKSCDATIGNVRLNGICKSLHLLKETIEASSLPSVRNVEVYSDKTELHITLASEATAIVTCARLNFELFDVRWKLSQPTSGVNFSFNLSKDAVLNKFSSVRA